MYIFYLQNNKKFIIFVVKYLYAREYIFRFRAK